MTQQFRTEQEVKGVNDFGQLYSDQIYNATLSATTNTQLTVPGGGVMGAMSSGDGSATRNKVLAVIRITEAAVVWFAVNQTAAAPAGASFAKATSEVLSSELLMAKFVKVGDVLNFYSPGTPGISVAFYALPS